MSRHCSVELPPSGIHLIDTYVTGEAIGVDGSFREGFFPGLKGYFSEAEFRTFRFIGTLYRVRIRPQLFRLLRKHQFLLREDYLRFSDYRAALSAPARAARLTVPDIEIGGVNISPLIRSELREGAFQTPPVEAVLEYRFIRRLSEARVKVRTLVDWFENQWMDRGLHLAFRRFYPASETIGYQGFIASEAFPSLFPLDAERLAHVVPSRIAVTGPGFARSRTKYAPSIDVVLGSALRYSWISDFTKTSGKRVVVLAALSHMDPANRLLLDWLNQVSPGKSFELRVRPHPSQAENWTKGQSAHPLEDRPMAQALRDVSLLVTAASGTALEALACGIPVVVTAGVGVPTINYIPSEVSNQFWKLAYDFTEIEAAIPELLRVPRKSVRKGAINIREQYFSGTSRRTVRALFGLTSTSQRK